MRKLFILFLLLLLPVTSFAGYTANNCDDADAHTWCILTTDTSVDGDTFCGGAACTSLDTIYIEGGARGTLKLKDFDGGGSYMTITNDPNERVVITGGVDSNLGALSITGDSANPSTTADDGCHYLDIRGDNLVGTTYGIKVIGVGYSPIHIMDQADHIKLSYIEVNAQSGTQAPVFLQDASEAVTWTWDTFEISNCYIYGSNPSECIYYGHNEPSNYDNPWSANFSVHDNIIGPCGGNAMVLKGVRNTSGPNNVYNNTIDNCGNTNTDGPEWQSGIRVGTQNQSNAVVFNVYNNRITNVKGAGIAYSKSTGDIYDNIIAGTGTGNDANYGHGITLYLSATNVDIYDNIIIQPTRYGIHAMAAATTGSLMSRNLIGDAGVGEWYSVDAADLTESAAPDDNIYHADVADFGFTAWSDDSDYTNDIFTFSSIVLSGAYPTSLQPCDNGSSTDTVGVTSSVNSNCKYSDTSLGDDCDTTFANLDNSFTGGEGGTAHTFNSTVNCDSQKVYAVKCQDVSTEEISNCLEITHSVAVGGGGTPQPPPAGECYNIIGPVRVYIEGGILEKYGN